MKLNFPFSRYRYWILFIVIGLLFLVILGRLFFLDTFEETFLIHNSEHQSIHYRHINATRGTIFDRNGTPLAVSVPIDYIIFDPKTLLRYPNQWQKLAENRVINLTAADIQGLISARPNSRYLIIKKDVPPAEAKTVTALHVPGVYLEQHFMSYYPMGVPMAQLIGFTNNNNQGQDGLELSYNRYLSDKPGEEAVLRGADGHVIDILKVLHPAVDGKNITLSIDSRIQFLAYHALAKEVKKVKAISGSVVVMNPYNGEVLAAVSYPSFNPNNVNNRRGPFVRDRAITDLFEPGSIMKSFTITAALMSGKYTPITPIDTSPGWIVIQGHTINDDSDNGKTTVTGVLKYSSNVGAAKIALSQPWNVTYDMIQRAGFGSYPGGGFPATATGILHSLHSMGKLEFATLAFGYDVAVSTLQLARAYSAFANGGILYPVSFIKRQYPPTGTRIMSKKVAKEMMAMLHTVVLRGGTGIRAKIKGYEIVGKTGTSNKSGGPHGLYKNRYNAAFAGIVPMRHPRLVIIVHVNDPQGWIYQFGGHTAAPVFASVAANCMRILGIPATES